MLIITRNRASIPEKDKDFSHFQATKMALCSTRTHVQWVAGLLSAGIKRPRLETDRLYLVIRWRTCGATFPYITVNRHIRLKQVWKIMQHCPWKVRNCLCSQEISLSAWKPTFLCSFTKTHPLIFPCTEPGDAISYSDNPPFLILFSLLCQAISIFSSGLPPQIFKYPLFFVTPCVLYALPILSFFIRTCA